MIKTLQDAISPMYIYSVCLPWAPCISSKKPEALVGTLLCCVRWTVILNWCGNYLVEIWLVKQIFNYNTEK